MSTCNMSITLDQGTPKWRSITRRTGDAFFSIFRITEFFAQKGACSTFMTNVAALLERYSHTISGAIMLTMDEFEDVCVERAFGTCLRRLVNFHPWHHKR